MSLDHPWLLWLLPLALLPLIARHDRAMSNTWALLQPPDRLSGLLDWALRSVGALALAALIIGLAGPYRPEYTVERVGTGAEIVLALDRSHSMDQGFAGSRPARSEPKGTGPEAIEYYTSLAPGRLRNSKGKVARQLLSEFAARRPDDRIAMIVFSTLPVPVLAFTQKQEAIQAAIAAADIGRGLSETNIGLALQSALSLFRDRPYTGSRIVMLVSDGGDRLDTDAKERVTYLARKYRVAIYWIYLRSGNSPGLMLEAGEAQQNVDAVPEYALNQFLGSIGTAYHAYEAGNSESLQEALDSVSRLENLPIAYQDTLPRRDGWPLCVGVALGCVLLLLAANLVEIRRWI